MIEHTDTVTRAGANVGVGAAGTSYTYLGLPMADLVGLATLVYLLFQTIVLAPKAFATLRNWFTRWRNPHG